MDLLNLTRFRKKKKVDKLFFFSSFSYFFQCCDPHWLDFYFAPFFFLVTAIRPKGHIPVF